MCSAEFLLNGLLDILCSMEDRGQDPLSMEARMDINWFLKFLPRFNGITIFDHKSVAIPIELDAGLQVLSQSPGVTLTFKVPS